ncbi:MAG: hypothetical protein J5I93_14060 [Pirellulaceae bacterium]|nr:hypothetical protein [Pirellulaceae bacterium]
MHLPVQSRPVVRPSGQVSATSNAQVAASNCWCNWLTSTYWCKYGRMPAFDTNFSCTPVSAEQK